MFGVTNPRFVGSYAEYAIASAAMIAGKLRSLSDVDAAGNVGAFAVQLAQESGIRVPLPPLASPMRCSKA